MTDSPFSCVYTTDTVQENENFASVPFKLCITEKVARQSLPNLTEFSGRIVLSLFLLLQKQLAEKSFYWPYINILPKTIKTPLLFDENDIKFIANTNLESAARDRKAELFKDYNRLLEHLPEGVDKNGVSWEEFLWCYSVFSSRSFPYQLIDPSSTEVSEVLFPLVDSLNHKPNTKITWTRNGDVETGSLSFVSGQVYGAGEEIFNNYGPKYNEHDHVALKPNFSRDPNHEMKMKIIQQCNITSGNLDPLTFYIHRNHIPTVFFKLMRVLVMNSMETKYYSICADEQLLDFVGYRNELAMLSMTLALLNNRLHAIKPLDVDVNNITYWQRFCLMYRKGQQDIFSMTLQKVEEMKRNLIQRMNQDTKENRIAPVAPFLSIVNPNFYSSTIEVDSGSPFITLDMVVITVKRLLNKHVDFASIVNELFEDLEEEADIIIMLCLIKENSNSNSEWRQFFDKISIGNSQVDESLQEMYESMIPAFAEEYPKVFDISLFTLEALAWADYILNNYSIDNPLAIVPL
ncbi:hypothetical protein MFLAVUS_004915 [Mucor flavus]|uniref:SET domain-containing protein n=1 Tax=Mucor flavus TaxID=439312 RepID=A0ABP9YX90_9FUNG